MKNAMKPIGNMIGIPGPNMKVMVTIKSIEEYL